MSTTPNGPSGFDPSIYLEPVAAAPVIDAAPIEPGVGSALFMRSLAFGLGGMVAGAVSYAAFILITHIQIGYLAIGVAWLVARSMMTGTSGRGGKKYQIAAVVLTLAAVGVGNTLMLWWHAGKPVHLTAGSFVGMTIVGFILPLLQFQKSTLSGALELFIIFIGLRAAWRMTSGQPGAVQHPFSR